MSIRKVLAVLAIALIGLTLSSSSVSAQTFTTEEKTAILGVLNLPRADVNWGEPLPPLEWDASLEATAQAWAQTCTASPTGSGLLAHNPNRSAGYTGPVGENIAGSWDSRSRKTKVTPLPNLLRMVQQWVGEGSIYDYAANTCAGEPYSINSNWKLCGHYTQIVSATTTKVGCGRSWCPNLPYPSTLVCNFTPAANVYDSQTGRVMRP